MTRNCVLVATDLSEESRRTADACAGLPGSPRLVLTLVTDEPDRAGPLEAEAARLRERGADVTARVTGAFGFAAAQEAVAEILRS